MIASSQFCNGISEFPFRFYHQIDAFFVKKFRFELKCFKNMEKKAPGKFDVRNKQFREYSLSIHFNIDIFHFACGMYDG